MKRMWKLILQVGGKEEQMSGGEQLILDLGTFTKRWFKKNEEGKKPDFICESAVRR